MSGIEVIAAIFGLAAIGCTLSTRLHSVGSHIASASGEIHSISKGVMSFSMILKLVAQEFHAGDSVYSSGASEMVEEVLSDCGSVFKEINQSLDTITKTRTDGSVLEPSARKKLKWCFKKGHVQVLLAQLESQKSNLLILLQVLSTGRVMAAISNNTAADDLRRREELIGEERAATLNIVTDRHLDKQRFNTLYTAIQYGQVEKGDALAELDECAEADRTETFAIEAAPSRQSSDLIIQPTTLNELDASIDPTQAAPNEIFSNPDRVVDILIYRWTRWQDFHPSTTRGIHELHGESLFRDREQNRRESLQQDRQPSEDMSVSQLASQPLVPTAEKKYAGLQASAEEVSTDIEDDSGSHQSGTWAPIRQISQFSRKKTSSDSGSSTHRAGARDVNGNGMRHPSHASIPVQSYTKSRDYSGSYGRTSSISSTGSLSSPHWSPRSSVSEPRSPEVQRPSHSSHHGLPQGQGVPQGLPQGSYHQNHPHPPQPQPQPQPQSLPQGSYHPSYPNPHPHPPRFQSQFQPQFQPQPQQQPQAYPRETTQAAPTFFSPQSPISPSSPQSPPYNTLSPTSSNMALPQPPPPYHYGQSQQFLQPPYATPTSSPPFFAANPHVYPNTNTALIQTYQQPVSPISPTSLSLLRRPLSPSTPSTPSIPSSLSPSHTRSQTRSRSRSRTRSRRSKSDSNKKGERADRSRSKNVARGAVGGGLISGFLDAVDGLDI